LKDFSADWGSEKQEDCKPNTRAGL